MTRSAKAKFAVFYRAPEDVLWCHETDADDREDAAEAARSLRNTGHVVTIRPMRNAPTRWNRDTINAFMGAAS